MDRTLISFNIPNVFSIVLMGAIGYVGLLLLSQVFLRGTTAAPSGQGSY